MHRWLTLFACLLLASGCDCAGPHAANGPCASLRPPPDCDTPCSATEPCDLGFYCADEGVCTADCDPLTPTVGCPDGRCLDDGHCIVTERPDGSLDASNVCADVNVRAMPVTPNVILVVDQSGSMTADFGSSNRWDVLRDSLLGRPDGLIFALQSQVRFGLALFSAEAPGNDPVVGECPLITWVPPVIDNFTAIDAVYGPADPIDETPTGESIDAILMRLSMAPDPTSDPTIFILATDGEPDTCAQPNPQNGQAESLAAVDRAYLAGVRTFVISVGEGTVSTSHLQDIANAGLGRTASDPDAPFWVAGDDAGLRDALGSIIGGELSCLVTLSGSIQNLDDACLGAVRLNGNPLTCDDPDGWRAVDNTHIELQGDACTTLQSGAGAALEATFPCDVILI